MSIFIKYFCIPLISDYPEELNPFSGDDDDDDDDDDNGDETTNNDATAIDDKPKEGKEV